MKVLVVVYMYDLCKRNSNLSVFCVFAIAFKTAVSRIILGCDVKEAQILHTLNSTQPFRSKEIATNHKLLIFLE